VQFFPESGNLIGGITSRVAFKAVGIDGLGVNLKGKITDNENKEVAEIETLHAGMGSFLLRPDAGKRYLANIVFADGTTKTIALPKIVDNGYVLAIYQPNKDSILIRINASANSQKAIINLIAQTSGETIFASPIKIEKAITSIWLEKKIFPTGIAQFTIFNNNGEPLNERIAFIRSNDLMQIDLKTVKNSYHSKEQIIVNLDTKDSKGKPTFGNFSVSVIDETKVPVDERAESTIFSNILLTSDLKGYVEKPNYYFIKETDEINKALDNLMLTQGYRRFTWKELDNTVNIKPVFPAEGLGVSIAGKVTTLTNKVLPNANVSLVSLRAKVMKTTNTDASGRFKFDGILMTDSIKFAVQARTTKNSNKVKLIMDSLYYMPITKNRNRPDISNDITGMLKTYLANAKKEDDIYEKTGQLDKVHRLREVRIKAKKNPAPTYTAQGIFRISEGHADKTIVFKDRDNCVLLANCLQGLLGNVRFQPIGVTGTLYPYAFSVLLTRFVPMRIILDGRLLDVNDGLGVFDGTMLTPSDVVKIDVVNSNMALMTTLVGSGIPVLIIYTNRGFVRGVYNPSIVNITPKGFNKVREFYSPRYDRQNGADKLPDLRTTIYWNPSLKTDVTGKTSFNFFNADGPGTYKVIVEGINADGELGRQIYNYNVD
jgi:hypothetical protein